VLVDHERGTEAFDLVFIGHYEMIYFMIQFGKLWSFCIAFLLLDLLNWILFGIENERVLREQPVTEVLKVILLLCIIL
jgi:hypothetical protein